MTIEFFFRLIGMVVFSGFGVIWGMQLSRISGGPFDLYAVVMGLVGALIGLILTPFFTTRPLRFLRNLIGSASTRTFFASLIGLMIGLVIATLLAYPLSLLPNPFGSVLPFLGAVIFGYLGAVIFSSRQDDVLGLFSSVTPRDQEETLAEIGVVERTKTDSVLIDTSVIIDGRIGDIARTGFIPGILLVPRFILNELQYIADSPDAMRRQRGRRGLEILRELQKDPAIDVTFSDLDADEAQSVDEKLVLLAKKFGYPILTNDYNLNRVADLQGLNILNINELTNAVKSVFLPGEHLEVKIIQEGKELGQGVGYLEDGTMIVVEDGENHIGEKIDTVVTKVLQTSAGRMIFSKPGSDQT